MDNKFKMGFGTEILKRDCKICGTEFNQKLNGRTREYCNDNCRDANKYLNAYINCLDKIDFKDYSYIKSIKGELFRLVNCLPKDVKK